MSNGAKTASRRALPLKENYFCDGPYYLLTSQSIGGLSPDELANKLSGGNDVEIGKLVEAGVCLPICFPGDCAMDKAIIVFGELSSQEESEWIGKISSKLEIPCGKFIFQCGGGDPSDIEGSVSGSGMSGFCDYFQKFDVEPGTYAVDVFAYVSSVTGNFFLEEESPMQEWQNWFKSSRKGEDLPEWLSEFDEYTMPGELEELVSYIVRLRPMTEALESQPEFDEELGWCIFKMRKPSLAPVGVLRSETLGEN